MISEPNSICRLFPTFVLTYRENKVGGVCMTAQKTIFKFVKLLVDVS